MKFSILLLAAVCFAACGDDNGKGKDGKINDNSHDAVVVENGDDSNRGNMQAAYYTCEHHAEVHENGPGKCPKCQMDLVKKDGSMNNNGGGNNDGTGQKESATKDHNHEEFAGVYYMCPDHPNTHEHASGKCPSCGKQLVKMEDKEH